MPTMATTAPDDTTASLVAKSGPQSSGWKMSCGTGVETTQTVGTSTPAVTVVIPTATKATATAFFQIKRTRIGGLHYIPCDEG